MPEALLDGALVIEKVFVSKSQKVVGVVAAAAAAAAVLLMAVHVLEGIKKSRLALKI